MCIRDSLYVGDPQIGASKGQPQGEGKLAADSGAANTAARNDGFAWDRTLDIAIAQHPDLNFVISAGDQVNKTGKPKEEEYAAYLSASALKNLSVATTIGNHDSLNPDYAYHFNNPNPTGLGATQAGGDYYYTYGSGLFIVLNTNNYNVAEHEQSIKKAVENFPDAVWRVVTIHQDIYGSGLDHSDTDGMILRTQLTPCLLYTSRQGNHRPVRRPVPSPGIRGPVSEGMGDLHRGQPLQRGPGREGVLGRDKIAVF